MFAAGELRRNWVDGVDVGDTYKICMRIVKKISLHDVKFRDEPTSIVIGWIPADRILFASTPKAKYWRSQIPR
jgi:hypothetical protein